MRLVLLLGDVRPLPEFSSTLGWALLALAFVALVLVLHWLTTPTKEQQYWLDESERMRQKIKNGDYGPKIKANYERHERALEHHTKDVMVKALEDLSKPKPPITCYCSSSPSGLPHQRDSNCFTASINHTPPEVLAVIEPFVGKQPEPVTETPYVIEPSPAYDSFRDDSPPPSEPVTHHDHSSHDHGGHHGD